MATTIKDIARLVGVTPTTVSMAVRGDKRISLPTRERVLKAARELNYRPNYTGRNLVKGKTNILAVVSPFFSSLFAVDIMRGIESSAGAEGMRMNQFSSRGLREKEAEMLREILYSVRPRALISISLKPAPEIVEEYRKENIPIILIEEVISGVSTIKTDNKKGGFLATDYLIKKGRTRIGLVVGKLVGELGGENASERLEGYKEALFMHGISFNPERVVEVLHYSFEDGIEAFSRLHKRDAEFDAIFCAAGDMTAAGVIRRARENSIKIGGELPIVGYDDNIIAPIITPSLTTVRQPVFEMGRAAIDLAVEVITSREKVRVINFDPVLVIRESA
jgi:LacI family transcriptional regulator